MSNYLIWNILIHLTFVLATPNFSIKICLDQTGYREGLEAGEEVKLQEGFDEGFVWGTTYGAEWARVRGLLR